MSLAAKRDEERGKALSLHSSPNRQAAFLPSFLPFFLPSLFAFQSPRSTPLLPYSLLALHPIIPLIYPISLKMLFAPVAALAVLAIGQVSASPIVEKSTIGEVINSLLDPEVCEQVLFLPA